ncbi:hypothetical protein BGZ83_011627, partial [Gryganskiella cystojenkinii]
MSALSTLVAGKTKKSRKSNPVPLSTEDPPVAKRPKRSKKVEKAAPSSLTSVIEEYPCLLDMSSEPLEGEIECSDSDADSDSDEESICDSINGASFERLSIQGHSEDELVDLDDLDMPRAR